MIDIECIFCNAKQGIPVDGDLKDFEGATLDCIECKKTMLIKDGELIDLNKILKETYRNQGLNIDDKKDYCN